MRAKRLYRNGRWIVLAAILLATGVAQGFAANVPAANAEPALLLGAAWYPEQWPESRWDEDLRLMEAAHLHVVRVGEFAWSTDGARRGSLRSGLAGARGAPGGEAPHRGGARHAH